MYKIKTQILSQSYATTVKEIYIKIVILTLEIILMMMIMIIIIITIVLIYLSIYLGRFPQSGG